VRQKRPSTLLMPVFDCAMTPTLASKRPHELGSLTGAAQVA
jgi:hypothetical protein